MLRKIRVGNFKCIEQAELELRKITVLIGPNSSGKSSILHAFAMLKQLMTDPRNLGVSGAYLMLGDFLDVVFRHEPRDSIKLGLEWYQKLPQRLREDLNQDHICNVSYSADLNPSFSTQQLMIGIGDLAVRVWGEGAGGSVEKKWIEPQTIRFRDREVQQEVGMSNFFLFPVIKETENVPTSSVREFNDFMKAMEHVIGSIYLVPIFRGFHGFAVQLVEKPTRDVFAEKPDDRPSALLSTLDYEYKILEKVASWMYELFQIRPAIRRVPAPQIERVPMTGRRYITLRDDKDLTTNLANEGAGTLQILYVLAQVALASEEAFVMIEEPEISLHPRAQAKLVDIMLKVLGEDQQLLITTHSEHILFRLLTHVASGKLKPNELAVWYFEKPDGVKAKASMLDVDERGMVRGGLRGFFEHEAQELSEYLRALSYEGTHPE